MRATLRKNGLKMITMSVKFHFGREHVIEVVRDHILFRTRQPYDKDETPTTRAGLLKMMRKAAHLHGTYYTYSAMTEEDTGIQKEEFDAATERATKIVDKAFPDLRA